MQLCADLLKRVVQEKKKEYKKEKFFDSSKLAVGIDRIKDPVDRLAIYIWQKARFCSYERQYIIKESKSGSNQEMWEQNVWKELCQSTNLSEVIIKAPVSLSIGRGSRVGSRRRHALIWLLFHSDRWRCGPLGS